MPRPRQEAVDLLVRAADVMAVLIGTWRATSGRISLRAIEKCDLRAVHGLNVVAGVRRIYPGFAVIVKVGVEALDVDVGSRLYVVVDALGKAVARPVVVVGAAIFAVCDCYVIALRVLKDGLRQLKVVDAAVCLIEGTAQQQAKFLAGAEALADRPVKPSAPIAVLNGVVPALAG